MTGESTSGSLGTARIDVTVNADTMAPGIAKARTAVAGMGTEAEAQYNKASAASKKYADSLLRQADLIGKSRAEQIAYNAQTRIGGELGAQIAAKALAQQTALTGAAGAAKTLANELNSFSDAQLFKINNSLGTFKKQAAEAAAAGLAAVGESDAEQAARLSAMVKASAAEQIGANTAVAESNVEVAASATARAEAEIAASAESALVLNAATLARRDAYARLQLAMAGDLKSTQGVIEAELALDEAMATGAITTREQAAYFLKLAEAEGIATVATEANTAAVIENAAAFKLSSRATTELGVVFGELASGNTGRLKYSMSALANQTGLLAKLMSLVGLVITGIIGALGLGVVAFAKGEAETAAFNKSLILTGDYAGVAADQLASMAKATNGTIGTQHAAAAALATVVSSGKFAGTQLQVVTDAALEMQKSTGQSIAETVKQFESLAGDPVNAIVKLNDTQHFLTDAVYEQIKALQDQGHAQEAADLAENTYAASIANRTAKVKENLGTLEKAWGSVKNAASEAWSAMLNIGRADDADTRLLKLQSAANALGKQLQALKDAPALGGSGYGNLGNTARATEIAQLQAKFDAAVKAYHTEEHKQSDDGAAADKAASFQRANELAITLSQEADKYASAESKRAKEIAKAHGQANEAISKLNAVSDAKLIAQIRANEAKVVAGIESRDKKPKTAAVDPFSGLDKLVQNAQVFDNGIGQDKEENKQVKDILAIVDAGAKLIASGHDVAKVQAEVALGVTKLNEGFAKQAALLETQNAAKLKAYKDSITQEIAARQQENDLQVQAIGMGAKEAQQLMETARIRTEVASKIEQLNRQRAQKGADTEFIDAEIAAQKDSIPILVKQEEDKWKAIEAADAIGMNGVKSALANFMDQQKNMAGQFDQLTTMFLGGFSDAFAKFVSGTETAKSAFGSLIDTMYQQALKFIANKAIQGLFDSFSQTGAGSASSTAGSSAGGWGSLLSNIANAFGFSTGPGVIGSANGNVFNSAGLSAFSGQIVDKPTMFAFARGAGLMGEAGPEAIMPLRRTAAGKLGVEVSGGSAGRAVSINQTIVVQGTINRRTASQIAQQSAREQRIAQSRNG